MDGETAAQERSDPTDHQLGMANDLVRGTSSNRADRALSAPALGHRKPWIQRTGQRLARGSRLSSPVRSDREAQESSSAEERAVAFEAWSAGHRPTPLLSDYAVSREAMYEGRDD